MDDGVAVVTAAAEKESYETCHFRIETTTTFDDENDLVLEFPQRIQIQFCLGDTDGGGGNAAPTAPALLPDPTSRTLESPTSFFDRPSWLLPSRSEDEDLSVKSVPYFELEDFNPSLWLKALDATTMGFAVVGLAMAITHPLLFVAGLVTAWGTAHAASKGYDCWLGLWTREEEESTANAAIVLPTTPQGALSISPETPTKNDPLTPLAVAKQETVGNDEATAEISTSSTEDEESRKKKIRTNHRMAPHRRVTSPRLRKRKDSVSSLPPNELWMLIQDHYPPLPNTIVEDQMFTGLNVIEFFQVFFDDNAPFNFMEFQKKRGDLNIHYGTWTAMEQPPISLHPPMERSNKQSISEQDSSTNTIPVIPMNDYYAYRQRQLTFHAKTNSSGFLGPAYAHTTKTQRILLASKKFAVLEMKTTLSNIPFADSFFVMERWIISASKKEDVGGGPERYYTTQLTIQMGLFFLKSCPFEGMIRNKTTTTVSEVVQSWCFMATQALAYTEQAKRNRLRAELGDDDDASSLLPECGLVPVVSADQEGNDGGDAIEMDIAQYVRSVPRRPSCDDRVVTIADPSSAVTISSTTTAAVVAPTPARRRFDGVRRTVSNLWSPNMSHDHGRTRSYHGSSRCEI